MVRLRGGSTAQPSVMDASAAATQELLIPLLPELLSKATQKAAPGESKTLNQDKQKSRCLNYFYRMCVRARALMHA
jgi:hypothetical protein